MEAVLVGTVFTAVFLVFVVLAERVAKACDDWMKPVFRGFLKSEVRSHYDEHD